MCQALFKVLYKFYLVNKNLSVFLALSREKMPYFISTGH